MSIPTPPIVQRRFMLAQAAGMEPDAGEGVPGRVGYPVAQYAASATPPVTVLAKGVRTPVPLVAQTAATSPVAFQEFNASRVAPDGSRILPATDTERLLARFAARVIETPPGLLGGVLGAVTGTLTGVTNGGLDLKQLSSVAAIYLEVDVGTATTPNVIYAGTHSLMFAPHTVGETVPLFGGAPFRANGARFFATSSVNGLSITDVRLLLTQSRA